MLNNNFTFRYHQTCDCRMYRGLQHAGSDCTSPIAEQSRAGRGQGQRQTETGAQSGNTAEWILMAAQCCRVYEPLHWRGTLRRCHVSQSPLSKQYHSHSETDTSRLRTEDVLCSVSIKLGAGVQCATWLTTDNRCLLLVV